MTENLIISVIITISLIFTGMVIFLVVIEHKLTRLEKEVKQLRDDLNNSGK
jgi:uncharacterized membrane protein